MLGDVGGSFPQKSNWTWFLPGPVLTKHPGSLLEAEGIMLVQARDPEAAAQYSQTFLRYPEQRILCTKSGKR